jgi:hypothetical protein
MSEQATATIENFTMPFATPGMPILWYPRGTYDRTTCSVAYMIHCGHRTAVLLTSTGQRRDAVRHVSDPKLSLSEDQRENGAWDFTDEYKRMKQMEASLMSRLGAIEQRLDAIDEKLREPEVDEIDTDLEDAAVVKPMPAKKPSLRGRLAAERLREYHRLVKVTRELGLDVGPKPTIKQMQAAVEAQNKQVPVDVVTTE